ncbi:DNA translocase FtsK [Treponema socranskii]|uniref:DNA translocase FtsK n=1 Tax=Treponema socranskii TaxID=53419 RepID=UPI003D6F693B
MERLNKPKYAAGMLLLLLAAFFSVSLMLQPFDFIAYDAGFGSVLFLLGAMLFSVYGFSSVLVPVFLFCAAMACFSGKWTRRKTMRLLTAVVPFFTAVITENICKSIAEFSSDFTGIKIGVTIALGAVLIVIEWLGAGIIADKIADAARGAGFKKIPQKKIPSERDIDGLDDFHDVNDTGTAKGAAGGEVVAREAAASETLHANETAREDDAYTAGREINKLAEETAGADNTARTNDGHERMSEDLASPFESIFDEDKQNDDAASVISEAEFTALTARDEAPLDDIEEIAWSDTFPGNDSGARQEDDGDDAFSETGDVPFWERENAERTKKIDAPTDLKATEIPPTEDAEEMNENRSDDFLDAETKATDIAPTDVEDVPEEMEESENRLDDFSDSEAKNLSDDFSDSETALHSAYDSAQTEESGASLDPDFFDIDMNAESDEETDNALEREMPRNLAGSVFSDMDEDVRKNVSHFNDALTVDTPVIQDAVVVSTVRSKNTKEELEDFFRGEDGAEKSAPPPKPEPVKKPKPKGPYKVPADLLTEYKNDQYWIIDDETKAASSELKETLNEFNIEADIIGIKKGPVVTMFELLPAPGVKLSKIAALQDNIALRLAASSVRIVAPIPGKKAVGIEIPNKERSIVSFREIVEKDMSEYKKMAVPVILGKDILGKPQIIDLVKTPHLLIAGATGSGKSVCVNSMILSILYKRSPQEVKLILIDPKIVELKLYNDIPHLLVPVITESKKAFQALQWALCEMERRYALLDGMGCRDVASYNKKIEEKHIATEKIPYIVLIIDEFADLMATTGKELESTVARLAAMSRAIGIHLVLATQRPSIDVITGLIKANIPARIAFMVASKMDSRIIIDQVGAEKLLGRGDMLYSSAVNPFPVRIQGTFVSDQEVEDVVEHVKKYGEPEYIDEEIFMPDDEEGAEPSLFDGEDPLYNQALDIVVQSGKASASYIQRRLKIGYNRAARLVEEMEARGIVGPANGSKPREIIHVP